MGLFHSPSIVTDGLVLALDAANTKSYPGTGNTWSDISGNGNNGTLVNSPTFNTNNNGYFSFDGSNNYVSFSTYSQPAYSTTTSFTWNIWVFPLRNDNADVYIGNRYGGTGTNFVKLTSNRFEYYDDFVGGELPLNNWINVSIVKDQTNLYYYRNGSLHASTTSSITKATQPFYVGGDADTERSLSRISQVSVYNRALSASEVAQNFEALRGRFGL